MLAMRAMGMVAALMQLDMLMMGDGVDGQLQQATALSASCPVGDPFALFQQPQPMVIQDKVFALDGKLLVVEIPQAERCRGAYLQWLSHRVFIEETACGLVRILLPIPLGLPAGSYELRLACKEQTIQYSVQVDEDNYPSSRLRVDPRFSKPPPPRVAKEKERIKAAFAHSHGKPLWKEPFGPPMGTVKTSPFGGRRLYNTLIKGRHLGIDYGGHMGEAIFASNDGRVTLVADNFFFVGSAVFLDHGEDLYTLYFHLSKTFVKVGDFVRKGQRIGGLGRSGRVTGPHLHFAVRLRGTYIDPDSLLAFVPKPELSAKEVMTVFQPLPKGLSTVPSPAAR